MEENNSSKWQIHYTHTLETISAKTDKVDYTLKNYIEECILGKKQQNMPNVRYTLLGYGVSYGTDPLVSNCQGIL